MNSRMDWSGRGESNGGRPRQVASSSSRQQQSGVWEQDIDLHNQRPYFPQECAHGRVQHNTREMQNQMYHEAFGASQYAGTFHQEARDSSNGQDWKRHIRLQMQGSPYEAQDLPIERYSAPGGEDPVRVAFVNQEIKAGLQLGSFDEEHMSRKVQYTLQNVQKAQKFAAASVSVMSPGPSSRFAEPQSLPSLEPIEPSAYGAEMYGSSTEYTGAHFPVDSGCYYAQAIDLTGVTEPSRFQTNSASSGKGKRGSASNSRKKHF